MSSDPIGARTGSARTVSSTCPCTFARRCPTGTRTADAAKAGPPKPWSSGRLRGFRGRAGTWHSRCCFLFLWLPALCPVLHRVLHQGHDDKRWCLGVTAGIVVLLGRCRYKQEADTIRLGTPREVAIAKRKLRALLTESVLIGDLPPLQPSEVKRLQKLRRRMDTESLVSVWSVVSLVIQVCTGCGC